MKDPEQPTTSFDIKDSIPELTPLDKITDLAIDLVDTHGHDDESGELKTATFFVTGHEIGEGRYPSLKINIPTEEVSDSYSWRAALTFGNQDPKLSRHILVQKDGTVLTNDYAGGKSEVLNELQIENLLAHFETIKDGLISDPA